MIFEWKNTHKRIPQCLLGKHDAFQTSKALEIYDYNGESEGLICSTCAFDIYMRYIDKINEENKK